jgi:hypothetical protein
MCRSHAQAVRGSRHVTPSSAPAASSPSYAHGVIVRLTAIEDCWVEFYVAAGASKKWIFTRAIDMRLGNPGGVKLTVDGKNPLPPGATHPITITLTR